MNFILLLFGLIVEADEPQIYKTKKACTEVVCYIKNEAPKYGVDVETALRIGRCESGFDPYAKNPHSTAKGTYQFIDKTWKNHCDGDVFNYKDNVTCFMEQYNKNPHWWECR